MEHALIATLVFVVVVVLLVWGAVHVINRTLPPNLHMPAKLVVGVTGLIAILYRLLPLAGL